MEKFIKFGLILIAIVIFAKLFFTIANAEINKTAEFYGDQKKLETFSKQRFKATKKGDKECFKILQKWYEFCFDNKTQKCEKLENQKKACI